MKLTPKILTSIYVTLCNCEPFTKWNLPLPEEINFVVDWDTDAMGTYCYDDGEDWAHTLSVSMAKCGHLDTVIRTVAHEMIHASRHQSETAWSKHDATFRRRAALVATELGFDPLEL
ncbi:MAG: hypothetical protein EBU33_03535 [Sphingobacteriia bacterium]|nr:hypothetical protein [Sphingobacteriia bacterium]